MSLVDRISRPLRAVLLVVGVVIGIAMMGGDFDTPSGRLWALLGLAVLLGTWLGLTVAQLAKSSGAVLNRRRFDEIERQLEHLRTPALMIEAGIVAHRTGNPRRARELLEEALVGEPDNDQARYVLGQVLAGQRDWAGAWRAFSAVYEREPDYDYGFVRLAVGETYLQLNEPALALRLADEFLARQPSHPAGHALRARVFYALGRATEGDAELAALQALVGTDPALRSLARGVEKARRKADSSARV